MTGALLHLLPWLRPNPAWTQGARMWAPRLRVMGIDCRLIMIGGVTAHERRAEPLLWAAATCVLGTVPGIIYGAIDLLSRFF